jgi:hypothetical protein
LGGESYTFLLWLPGLLRSKKCISLYYLSIFHAKLWFLMNEWFLRILQHLRQNIWRSLVSYINMRLGDSLMSEMSCHSSSDLFLVRVFYVQICLVLFRVTVSNACLMRTLLSIHQEHKRLKISSGSIPEKARKLYNR